MLNLKTIPLITVLSFLVFNQAFANETSFDNFETSNEFIKQKLNAVNYMHSLLKNKGSVKEGDAIDLAKDLVDSRLRSKDINDKIYIVCSLEYLDRDCLKRLTVSLAKLRNPNHFEGAIENKIIKNAIGSKCMPLSLGIGTIDKNDCLEKINALLRSVKKKSIITWHDANGVVVKDDYLNTKTLIPAALNYNITLPDMSHLYWLDSYLPSSKPKRGLLLSNARKIKEAIMRVENSI
ncbi:hypothetical protein [Halobacteriovorax sp. ZH2_bin.1]|uniref:hypothetical protein n=1 Tax=unclassified Halobacteriovorax TaxID=2639665 RepID=UPI00371D7590